MEAKRVIVTVIGRDRVGIIAAVANTLAENQVNILDISQTILQDFFTMMMIVDISQSPIGIGQLQETLTKLGESIGMQIQAQHEDIFRYMHRI
ncbi:MAG: ACT domain-containing protein [Peptococcaceae bacterium]|nr:ACT domain-containing protein [Peptococcaceae bacterium]